MRTHHRFRSHCLDYQILQIRSLHPTCRLSQDIPTSHQVGEDHVPLVDDWKQAVDYAIANQHHDPEQIAIYTDGSKLWNDQLIQDTSGWSFVVTAKWPSSTQWGIVGHCSASVDLNNLAQIRGLGNRTSILPIRT